MFDRLLVPLDGSPTSEAILPYAARCFPGAELTLLRCPELPEAAMPPDPSEIAEEVDLYLGRIRERLEGEGRRVRTRAGHGRPAEAILELARAERPDLIAMATHGRSGSSRLLLGSVAERVLRSSPVPVFLVRPFGLLAVPRPPRNILVPLDQREGSLAVLSHVMALTKTWDGRVVLLHVARSPFERRPDAPVQESLARIQDEFAAAGIPADRIDILDELPGGILDVARSRDVDLIAMATSAGPLTSRLEDESVTARVLRNARAPLYVVRAEADVAAARPEPRERI